MEDLLKRITFNPKQCGGRPYTRGMRIRVTDVLDLLAAGLTPMEIVEELPALEIEDVTASILYSGSKTQSPCTCGMILWLDAHLPPSCLSKLVEYQLFLAPPQTPPPTAAVPPRSAPCCAAP
jgi:uncharacterized protein (DUF433 family)